MSDTKEIPQDIRETAKCVAEALEEWRLDVIHAGANSCRFDQGGAAQIIARALLAEREKAHAIAAAEWAGSVELAVRNRVAATAEQGCSPIPPDTLIRRPPTAQYSHMVPPPPAGLWTRIEALESSSSAHDAKIADLEQRLRVIAQLTGLEAKR